MGEISKREQMIFDIAAAEWEMFQNVENTGGRASCQNDPDTFFKMRMSQWMVYPDTVLESYFADCREAAAKGWNLIFEKYARMMETVYPEEYEKLLPYIPAVSDQKKEWVEALVSMHLEWDRKAMEQYPNIRQNGRVMTTQEDSMEEGSSSESYFRAELMTYSDKTVELIYDCSCDAWEKGENLLLQIIENETKFYGYASIEDAEAAHAKQAPLERCVFKPSVREVYDFDRMPDRKGTDSVKWSAVKEDVIPMWVADMDIQAPPAVLEAAAARISHPYYGYPTGMGNLTELIVQHYQDKYQAQVKPEWVVWVPSVIPGVVNALKMMGGTFMYSVPMYDHIRHLFAEANLPVIEVPMKIDENQHHTMDMEALEAAIRPEVTSLILCNPHNPVGRMYSEDELLALQTFCKKHDLLLISDEIHCELAFDKKHIPYFSLNEQAKEYSVTLSSAGKICNIPGLPLGFAIIPDEKVRKKFIRQQDGQLPGGNIVTLAAYEKAYDGSCDEWKSQLRTYLAENRDIAEKRFNAIPEIKTPHNEGTYLLWLDCSALHMDNPAAFFEKHAHVKVNSGEIYGNIQCVRFNYGCPRAQMVEAIDRMEEALSKWRAEQ